MVSDTQLQLWSLEAAAEELHTKPSTLRQYIREGSLRAIWMAGRYLVENDVLLAFVDSRRDMVAPSGRKKGNGASKKQAVGEEKSRANSYRPRSGARTRASADGRV